MGNDTSVPTGYIASVPLVGLAALLLLLGGITGSTALLVGTIVAICAILVLNRPFLRLLHLHGGTAVGTLGAGLLLVELFTAGLGSVYGIATFIAGKKY